MNEKSLEIIDEAAEELGLFEHTNLGLNALESELLHIDQRIEAHISSPISEQLNKNL